MVCYAVIDTNVLVSALLSSKEDSATVQVLNRLIAGAVIPLYSREIMREYQEVLCRRKFCFSPDIVNYLLSSIEKLGLSAGPSPSLTLLPDEKDAPFYDLVLGKRELNAYLVTGNLKHFPREPFVITPRQLIEILNSQGCDQVK